MVLTKKAKKDFTVGPIFVPMLTFVLPLMLTSILQVFYNMADKIVVGQFSGDTTALAAIGSTASLTTLFVNFAVGTMAGVGVAVAHAYGAKEFEQVGRIVHTSFCFAAFLGVLFAMLAAIFCKPILVLMGTKEELLSGAVTYMLINCIGIPATAVYNCGAGILRSTGDSKTSLYILSSTGIINVLLNLFFVICCHMSVEGVAIATVTAKYLSAIAVVCVLRSREDAPYRLRFSELRVDPDILKKVMRYGLPMGVQSSLFSLSNVFITGAVNTFPTEVITARSIANSIDELLGTALASYCHASTTFVGQNYGARNPERIKRSIYCTVAQSLCVGITVATVIFLLKSPIALLYIDPTDPAKDVILAETKRIMSFMLYSYLLHGVMNSLAGAMRGLGYSISSMIINLIASCGLRVLYLVALFPLINDGSILKVCAIYPITWLAACLIYVGFLLSRQRKIKEHCEHKDEGA